MSVLLFIVGFLCGVVLLYFFLHKETVRRVSAEEKLKSLDKNLSDNFAKLSAEALKQNNESFLGYAKLSFEKWQQTSNANLEQKKTEIGHLTKPLAETLSKFDNQVKALEVNREGAYRALQQQIQSLITTQGQLKNEAENLSRVLHAPTARGRWGEIQLRRVVEMAGMLSYCDFEEQVALKGVGNLQRPDMIVRLPGDRCVAIDAKVPLQGYLQAMECAEEAKREKHLEDYAEQLKRHIVALSKKDYGQMLERSPEFVVLFLPGEIFFSVALDKKPELIEFGTSQNVIVATPTTLIALLKAVAYGWRHEKLAENSQKISKMARELSDRSHKLSQHFTKLGKNLSASVESYNQTLGSLESRVFSSVRKIRELENLQDKQIERPVQLENATRLVNLSPVDTRE